MSPTTASIEEQNRQLSALYAVSTLASEATDAPTLARGFIQEMRRVAECDGVALRLLGQEEQNYSLLAADGLPAPLIEYERSLPMGICACCQSREQTQLRVISTNDSALSFCRNSGFRTVISIPLLWQRRLQGQITLFYKTKFDLPDATRRLLSSMASHLVGALESLQIAALEREAAVTAERKLIARELHDSIAQSLFFLKIQTQVLRTALGRGDMAGCEGSLDELDVGISECLADVRELLVHFRTLNHDQDMEGALRATLAKFKEQTGLDADLSLKGRGIPLAPDAQVQILHIVQEALSNVRKHADAKQVRLHVWRQPYWRIEIRDDGVGFDPASKPSGSMHVGLEIMRERAQRIGAKLRIMSAPGQGSCVAIDMPSTQVQGVSSQANPEATAE